MTGREPLSSCCVPKKQEILCSPGEALKRARSYCLPPGYVSVNMGYEMVYKNTLDNSL